MSGRVIVLQMAVPKILVIPGSLRTGSSNARLAALAAKELVLAEAEVTRISLEDYTLPLFDGDFAADAIPPAAVQLKRMLLAHHGVFITCPEYNASVPPLIKNAIDWVTRVRDRGEPPNTMFKGRAFAIAFGVSRRPWRYPRLDGAPANPGTRLWRAGDPRAGCRPARGPGL